MRARSFDAVLRNAVFGVEDSLVSTVGFLSGLASAQVSRPTLFLSGFILIAVEAFSMAIGSLLSETSVEELKTRHTDRPRAIGGSLVMFISFFASGFIPLLPYVFCIHTSQAFFASVFLSLSTLFVLGWMAGRLGKGSNLWSAVRMTCLGGLAILIGIAVGRLANVH